MSIQQRAGGGGRRPTSIEIRDKKVNSQFPFGLFSRCIEKFCLSSPRLVSRRAAESALDKFNFDFSAVLRVDRARLSIRLRVVSTFEQFQRRISLCGCRIMFSG